MSCNRKGKSMKGLSKGLPFWGQPGKQNRKTEARLDRRLIGFDRNPPLCHGSPMSGTGHKPGAGKPGRLGGLGPKG